MKRLLPLVSRNYPRIVRRVLLPALCTLYGTQMHHRYRLNCSSESSFLSETISKIQRNAVEIELNGNVVGQAYFFTDNHLVSVSYETQNSHNQTQAYQFRMDGKKLTGTFRVVGHFENLTFYERTSDTPVEPITCDTRTTPFLISAVQIFMNREYPSIRNGYMVARDSGFGIVDGRGEIGGLVIKDGKAAGIITHIGRDLQSGFCRVIEWSSLGNILCWLQQRRKAQLGLSAQAHEGREGIEVVRVAPNSPLREEMMMGDVIVRANGYRLRQVQALQRICVISNGKLRLDVLRDQAPLEINLDLY